MGIVKFEGYNGDGGYIKGEREHFEVFEYKGIEYFVRPGGPVYRMLRPTKSFQEALAVEIKKYSAMEKILDAYNEEWDKRRQEEHREEFETYKNIDELLAGKKDELSEYTKEDLENNCS